MSRKDEWVAEMKLYENLYRNITKRKTRLIEIPPREMELGYTSSDGTIHIARRHAIMGSLTEEWKQFFRMGVFAHEMCHQIFTDFFYLEETLKKHPWKLEKEMIALFSNLVEDPAIEYWAETEFGGDLLAALRFSIAHIYKVSPDVNETKEPINQLCNALIQFGDMGLLKGKFTSKEAFEYFKKIAPEFNAAVINPNPRERIDCAVRWAELTKPLWAKDTEEEEEKMLDNISQIQKDNSISKTSGTGSTPKTPETSPEGEPEKENRKKEMLKRVEKASQESDEDAAGEEEKNAGLSESGKEDTAQEEGETAADSKPEADEKAEEDAGKTESSDADEESEKEDSEGSENEGMSSDQNQTAEDSDTEAEKDGEQSDEDGKPNNTPSWDDTFDGMEDGKDVVDKELRKMDKRTLDSVKSVIERSADGIANRRKRDEINFNVKSRHYGSVSCLNEVMKVETASRNEYQAAYADIMKRRARDISLLTASLRKIFQQDTGENIRALSGRYNVVRASKQSSVKIFDRRRAPKNLDDLAVMLLIDESGSMTGIKEEIAKETAITMAESFAKLNIPCYIMGFTTGSYYSKKGRNYDAVHHHYVSWKNTKEERLTLAGISAQASNFDGYAIRNATAILKKKPAEHKILFVISDGYPACKKYRSQSEGIADTTEAIQEAKKAATVLGIGIGDCQPEILKHMYKGSFVHAKNVDDLSITLTRNLRKILKNF